MEAAKRISVHVVGTDFGAACSDFLASLEEQTVKEYQLLVVDNASQEGAASLGERSDTFVLRNIKRQSSARCQNQAIALALSRWEEADLSDRFVFFTRPDAILSPRLFERLLAVMDADAACGMAVPAVHRAKIMWSEDGEREFDLKKDIVTEGYVVTRGRRLFPAQSGEEKQVFEIFSPSPAAVLVRASVLKDVLEGDAWLDDAVSSIPAFADLAWRARLTGWNVKAAPEAQIWIDPRNEQLHKPASTRLDSGFAVREAVEWRSIQSKNDQGWARWKHAPWIAGAALLRWAATIIRPWTWGHALQHLPKRVRMRPLRASRDTSRIPKRDVIARWFV